MDLVLAKAHMAAPTNEAVPRRADNYHWSQYPDVQHGIDLTGKGLPSWDRSVKHPTYPRLLAWFTVYRESGSRQAKNTRVQVKNIRLYVKSKKTGQWALLDSTTNPIGGEYDEAGPKPSIPWKVISELEGISVNPPVEYCSHGWGNMVTVDVTDVAGIYADCNFRVITADRNAEDTRMLDKWVVNVGVDCRPRHPYRQISNVFQGRYLKAIPEWRLACGVAE